MSERNEEAQRLARKVADGGIVQKATERLIYQIVEVCAEHERENTEALRARVAQLEAALRRCRQGWHNLEELYGVDPDAAIAEIDAVLKDAPQ